MKFRLFNRFEEVAAAAEDPAYREYYAVLGRMRQAALEGSPEWAHFHEIVDYAKICYWAVRKLEYSFAARACLELESDAPRRLRILDVGCGVVPFCNWLSRRGHEVTALDPSQEVIQFLRDSDLNSFYESRVTYEVGRGENLRFDDESFDLVTCVSVLEHVPPGNDRLCMREMARVLTRTGSLVITFDVAPPPLLQPGEQPWPVGRRRYAQPFSPPDAERLLASISGSFDVDASAVPSELYTLDWDAVHEFWRASQQHDGRDDPVREYLAMGGVLNRQPDVHGAPAEDFADAYLEGQAALEERVAYFQAHAQERLALVRRLDDQGQILRSEVEEKERAINDIQAAADERLELARRLQGDPAALLPSADVGARVASLEQIAHEDAELLATIAQGVESLRVRLDTNARVTVSLEQTVEKLVLQVEGLLSRNTSLTPPPGSETLTDVNALMKEARLQADLLRQFEQLRREKETAEAAAEARLGVIEEQKRTIEAYRRTRLVDRLRSLTAPRIGVLYHYPPRKMRIPDWYATARAPDSPPLISIVTPSLNQGQFLERTLQSVIGQGYPRVEHIVQDGGSSDESIEVLDRLRPQLTFVASEKDSGFADAINRGFLHAQGEILAYLNSDDLLLPGTLRYVARYFAAHPDVDVVYGHRVVVDEYDGEIGRWVLPPHNDEILSWADYVPQETLFWRRGIWEKSGGAIDETFRFAVDWDLLIRFRDAGAKMRRLPRFLGAFRVHPHQKTSAEMLAVGTSEMDVLRERALGRKVTTDEISAALAPYLRHHVVLHKLYRLGVLRY